MKFPESFALENLLIFAKAFIENILSVQAVKSTSEPHYLLQLTTWHMFFTDSGGQCNILGSKTEEVSSLNLEIVDTFSDP